MSISPTKKSTDVSRTVDFTAVEEQLHHDFLESGAPSLAVAVARHGELILETAFGWADVERRVPATIDTMYSLASTTKPFTATALMILADRYNPRSSDCEWPPASGASPGWAVAETPWGPLVGSAGGMLGASAQLVFLPSEGIAISAVANSSCKIPHAIDGYVLPTLIPGYPADAEWHRPPPASMRAPEPGAADDQPLIGEWRGVVHTYDAEMPVALRFLPSGAIHATLGHQQQITLVNEVELGDGWVRGNMAGCIETADAMRRPRHPGHHVRLELKLRGDRLGGVLISFAGNILAHWTELRRQDE